MMTDLTLPAYSEVALHQESFDKNESRGEYSQNSKSQSIPIELAEGFKSIIPKIQQKRSGINISQFNDYNITGYKINEFTGSHSNRNHYSDRSKHSSIKYLIIHYSGGEFLGTLATFTDSKLPDGVGAHYVITQKENSLAGGTLVSVAPEEKLAKHAGRSGWHNDKNLNDMSIGVVNINKGFIKDNHRVRWFSFDDKQIETCGALSAGVIERYGINPVHVLGHADVAPQRHVSPGPLFPWGKLYHQYGVGAWLDEDEFDPEYIRDKYDPEIHSPEEIDDVKFLHMLQEYGYPMPRDINLNYVHNKQQLIKLCASVIQAFKAHFSANQHPNEYNNLNITYNDKYWIWALTAKYKSYLK